jgi:hypothetical protein
VSYHTEAGTAAPGEDFVPASGTLTFDAGSPDGTEQTVSVVPVDDARYEATETLSLELSQAVGAAEGRNTLPITILDDDLPSVSVGNTRVAEDSVAGAPRVARFPVSLDAWAGPVSVRYHTVDGTARENEDYVPTSDTLVFESPTQLTQTVPVTIIDDGVPEEPEEFCLILDAPSGAVLGNAIGCATISDKDKPPTPKPKPRDDPGQQPQQSTPPIPDGMR